MRKILALLATLACSFAAHATTYYVVDCQTGADTNCTAGNDTNSGTVSTSPRQNYTNLTLAAGDIVLLANGGSWILTTSYVPTNVSNLTWSSYTPTWCVSTCASGPTKPLITTNNAGWDAFYLHNTSPTGYLIQNLKLVGTGAGNSSPGIYFYPGMTGVTINNVDISAFAFGISVTSASAQVIVKNSSLHDNMAIGFFGGAHGLLVENNTFDNNGATATPNNRNHNLYISGGSGDVMENIVLRGNSLTRSAVSGGLCQGNPIVVHGTTEGLVIENNYIDETTGASGGCYGIQVIGGNPYAEGYNGTIIRGNKIVNVGTIGIQVGACPYCVIENNILTWILPSVEIIGISTEAGGAGDAANTNITIRNNSIYNSGTDGSGAAIRVSGPGTGYSVYNNVIYLASATSSAYQCYNTLALTSFTAFDYNDCYRSGGVNTYSNLYSTLALAQAAGADVHGSVSNPSLTATPASGNGYDIAFTSGLTKNGGTAPCPKTTYGGLSRASLGTCDIGAHQQGASVLVPNSPTWAH